MENMNIRMVGGASEEIKGKTLEELRKIVADKDLRFEQFDKEEAKSIREFELPKSERELEIIDLANRVTNELMYSLGADAFDFPADNIHLLPEEKFSEYFNKKAAALANPALMTLIVNSDQKRRGSLFFAVSILHEFLHLKNALVLEVPKDFDVTDGEQDPLGDMTIYKTGLKQNAAWIKQGQHEHFLGLEEAVVSDIEKRLMKNLASHPLFKEELDLRQRPDIKEKIQKLFSEEGVAEEEISWINPESPEEVLWVGYSNQRKTYEYVISEIQSALPGRFVSANGVKEEFEKAMFKGNTLSLAKLVNEVFGPDGWRRLGDMGADEETPINTIEALRKMRLRQKKTG